MADLVFGSHAEVGVNPSPANGQNHNGWLLYTSEYCSTPALEPGDVIRCDGHSAIVWTIDGDTLNVGEVWGQPRNETDNCRINWGFFNSKIENTVSRILNHATYILKAPKTCSTYRIKNVATGKVLTVNGSAISGTRAIQLTNSGTVAQKWLINIGASSVTIKTSLNNSLGLKYAQDATSYCKIFNVANNDSDAHLQIIQNGSYSKIKFDNYDLYLSADASGSNVYWATSDTSAYQRWTITQI